MSERQPRRRPRYAQIVDALRSDIDKQVFPVGSYLPSEAALAERFEVAPGTMRQALKVLVEEGVLSARRGAKKIVLRAPRSSSEFGEFRSFAQWAYSQGKEPGGEVLLQSWVKASELDARLLRVEEGTPVLNVVRVRTLDGEPVMLEHTHYPQSIGVLVADLPKDTPSVTNVLRAEKDVEFVAADHVFGVGAVTEAEAKALHAPQGTPLLVHRRVSRDRFGTPLERSEDKYLPNSVSLAVSNTEASNSLNWTSDQHFDL